MKQTVAIAAVLVLCLNLGCHVRKVSKLDVGQVAQPEKERIIGITTKSGEEVSFDPPGGTIEQGTVRATVTRNPYRIPLQDVQRLWIQEVTLSTARTVGLTVGIAIGAIVAVAAIVALTKQSCPFVYSWNGSEFVFDGEPYGGAITRGLEKDDYSELEFLKAKNGTYRLLLTNEVDETQHTNLAELLVVDHAAGSRVVSDEFGNLNAYSEIENLSSARDGNGTDLLPWLRKTDRLIWEPDAVAGPDGSLRKEILLSFPKPTGAGHAALIANAATGLWGSYMIKRMVELYGRGSAAWLASLDRDPAAVKALHTWGESEGTYRLAIEVQEGTTWQSRGSLPGGGPLLAEDRAIPLDISRVTGNEVRIRLRPPAGFWAFNSFRIAYGIGAPKHVSRVAPEYARTVEGRDILSSLSASDDRYYSMPDTTDRAEIRFAAPPEEAGLSRTLFLHSRGWYQLHLRNSAEPDLAAIQRLMTQPGASAQFAADRFAEWRQGIVR